MAYKYHLQFTLIFLFITIALNISAQADNQTWSSIRLRSNLNEKTQLDVRPIVRHFKDLTTYQNSSIDISVKRKFSKGWYGMFLARTFFIPQSSDVQFLWGDIGYVFKNSKIAFTNRVRLHWALDLNDKEQGDFIRYQTALTPNVAWKAKPFFIIEPWFQLNGLNKVTRMRYEAGLNFPLPNQYNFTFMYRRQDSANTDPANSQNMFVMTITCTLI